jgi:hypothetical protein
MAGMLEGLFGSAGQGGMFGMDKDTSGLLGMALLGRANPNHFMMPLFMMKMLGGNQQQVPPGINPSYKPQIPQPIQQAVSNLNTGMAGLDPVLQEKIPLIMDDLRAKGWQPKIASAIRTPEEQAEKVRLGYSKTMNSKHLKGKAVDIVDERYGWKGDAANPDYQFWKDLGEAALRHGLQWGGNWKTFRDVAHIQTALANQPGLLNQYYA